MKDSRLWAQGSRFYEQLKVVGEINNFGSWSQAYRCYEQLFTVVDMNDFGS